MLVTGGSDLIGPLPIAEVYNPALDIWSSVSAMNVSRAFHTATLLDDGRVLVAGGVGGMVQAHNYGLEWHLRAHSQISLEGLDGDSSLVAQKSGGKVADVTA